MKKFILMFLVFAFLGVSASAQQQMQLQLDRTDPARTRVGALEFRGAVVVPPGPDKVGGLSGLWVAPGGRELVALSDSGRVYKGTLTWANNRLAGVRFDRGQKLVDENGQPVTGRARFDAEALVHRKDGSWLVAFERDHRIEQYKDFSIAPVPFVLPPGLSPLPRNQGLEALTELPDGRLFAIAEAAGSDGMHSAWLWQSGNWLKLNYQPAAGLRPSDMASLPNGDVLVLERWFNVFYGFRIRIARLDGRDLREGSSVAAQTLAELESPMITENFEAISTETLQDGTVRIYLSSDNNFNAAQQTILAVFDLSPDSPPSR